MIIYDNEEHYHWSYPLINIDIDIVNRLSVTMPVMSYYVKGSTTRASLPWDGYRVCNTRTFVKEPDSTLILNQESGYRFLFIRLNLYDPFDF